MSNPTKIASFLFCAVAFFSCTKVIKVNLKNTDKKVVIEASVTDQPGPYEVKITQTVNFDQTNIFPAVTGATVTLADDAGNTEILSETAPGIYHTATMSGTPGRTYTLTITTSGQTYTAVSKMPPPILIDSLKNERGGFRGERNVRVFFTDPAGVGNWYRFIKTVNDSEHHDIYVTPDLLRDGEVIDQTLRSSGNADSLTVGDSVTIAMQCIDEPTYNYFRTLAQITGGGDPGTAPANPLTNFNNGALGYFSAHTETRKAIIVK